MVVREPNELNETLKAEDFKTKEDNFKVVEGQVKDIRDIKTTYGNKVVLVIKDKESNNDYDIFINNVSMLNLCRKFGDEDSKWKDKEVVVTKSTDSKFNRAMLVVEPKEYEEEKVS